MNDVQLKELHAGILYAQITAQCALESIKTLVGENNQLHFNAEALERVVDSLQSSLKEVDNALRPARAVALEAKPPALAAESFVMPVQDTSQKKWDLSTGVLEGETAQAAAVRWADWSAQHGQVMLSRFLAHAAPKLRKMAVSEVYMVCDAYESGIGHGLKKDGKSGDYYGENAVCNEAYKVGYNFGVKKEINDKPPVDDHAIAVAVSRLTDVAVAYNKTQQLRERISQVVVPLIHVGRKDSARMRFLHTNGPNNPDKEGFEWGVYRVKWGFDGHPVQVLQTLADCTDLDRVMQDGTCEVLRPRPSSEAS